MLLDVPSQAESDRRVLGTTSRNTVLGGGGFLAPVYTHKGSPAAGHPFIQRYPETSIVYKPVEIPS